MPNYRELSDYSPIDRDYSVTVFPGRSVIYDVPPTCPSCLPYSNWHECQALGPLDRILVSRAA